MLEMRPWFGWYGVKTSEGARERAHAWYMSSLLFYAFDYTVLLTMDRYPFVDLACYRSLWKRGCVCCALLAEDPGRAPSLHLYKQYTFEDLGPALPVLAGWDTHGCDWTVT